LEGTLLKSIVKRLLFFVYRKTKWRRYSFGSNFHCGRGVVLWAKNKLIVGDNFYIGKYSQIECDAVIGNNVILANFVSLVGRHDHNYKQIGLPIAHSERIINPDYKWKGLESKIEIQDDVWVGLGSIILSGVTIGEGSIVAAGSVVTKNVEPYSIYGGVPAVKISNRFDSESDLNRHLEIIREKNKTGELRKPIVYR